jgi:hypothetical protein
LTQRTSTARVTVNEVMIHGECLWSGCTFKTAEPRGNLRKQKDGIAAELKRHAWKAHQLEYANNEIEWILAESTRA